MSSDNREQLCEIAQKAYQRGWCVATSGNFSILVDEAPLRIAVSASGVNKGELRKTDLLVVNERFEVESGDKKPSAETGLHFAIVRSRAARAILHTHSVWNTILSEEFFSEGSLVLEGYEMLKALSGVNTHFHREVIPIYENTQDIDALSIEVEKDLASQENPHAFLIRGHGLYTWGKDLEEAWRHLEALEFLFEVSARRLNIAQSDRNSEKDQLLKVAI